MTLCCFAGRSEELSTATMLQNTAEALQVPVGARTKHRGLFSSPREHTMPFKPP